MKPGGRLARYLIHTPEGLSATGQSRACELGPAEVVGSPDGLAQSAGFVDVTLRDATGLFRTTCEGLLEASLRWEDDLRAEQGDEAYVEGRRKGEAMLTGIREGLLLRSMIVGVKPRGTT